jgi:N-acylglucosamine 2-epimerase
MSIHSIEKITHLLEEIKEELYGSVLPFWLQYSFDEDNGGFFNNLAQYGEVFDSRKHLWLQGRQCFMFARIANTHTDKELETLFSTYTAKVAEKRKTMKLKTNAKEEQSASSGSSPLTSKAKHTPLPLTRQSLITSARRGVQFLLDHAFQENGHVLFALDQTGQPALHQRKIFSATFLIMAFAEVSKCCNEPALFGRAKKLFEDVLSWVKDPNALGKPGCSGSIPYQPLNVPMILLNVVNEMATCIPVGHPASSSPVNEFYKETVDWCATRILQHAGASHGKGCLENILSDGSSDFSTPDGRLLNPGHSIEAGWFLLEHARKRLDAALEKRAREIIDESFTVGWDASYGNGGFIYFRDIEGFDPTLLEKDSKLWWPMCEAMIAYAMAAESGVHSSDSTEKPYDTAGALNRYEIISRWAMDHFSDLERGGEWFGYLDRDGRVTHSFKGGPYKGCFHVPRALLFVEQALTRLLNEKTS